MFFKKTFILLLIGLGIELNVVGQVKIGDDVSTIHPFSLLELESTTKALIISRLSNSQMLAMTPLEGALVFNTDTKCLHMYNGLNWQNLCSKTSTSLSIVDNADGSFTLNASDGTSYTSPNLIGPKGDQGEPGPQGEIGPPGDTNLNATAAIGLEQIIVIANSGQTQFTTPFPISDIKKIEVFRNGVGVDFTAVDSNTIELEIEATCHQDDRVRIIQIL